MPSCESSPSRSRAQEVIARDVRGMRAVYPTCIVEVSPIEPDCLCGRPVVVRCTYTRHAYTLGYDPQPQPQPGRRAVRLVDANARQLSVVGAGDARAQALAPARTQMHDKKVGHAGRLVTPLKPLSPHHSPPKTEIRVSSVIRLSYVFPSSTC